MASLISRQAFSQSSLMSQLMAISLTLALQLVLALLGFSIQALFQAPVRESARAFLQELLMELASFVPFLAEVV